MHGRVIILIVLTLIISTGGICSAGTNSDPNDYPTEEPTFTVEPTFIPTEEPTFTVEPTSIGGDTGYISITSSPTGAFVEFDGVGEGTTPLSIPVKTTSTPSHSIRITKTGYLEWTGHITGNPGPGETIYQSADLVAIQPTITPEPTFTVEPTSVGSDSGFFKIDSVPQGADVYFDSIYYGTSPALVKVAVTGTPSHDYRVSMNGYRDYSQHLSYNPGRDETVPLFASLVPLAQYGSIVVTSNPSGALATLDSGQQYLTPCTFTQVVSGMHTITVTKSGYNPYLSQVQVNYNSQPQVYAPLTKFQTTGTLYIDSAPQGADVKVDNLWQGQTPQRVGNLAGGTHMVKLQLSGYQTVSQDVMITSGQETRISPTLVRNPPDVKTGSISVFSNPPGASVFLNDNYQGTTQVSGNLDLTDLAPGIYTVYLSDPQYEDYSSPVTVIAGQVTPVTVTLKAPAVPSALNGTLSMSSSPAGAQVLLNNQFVGDTPLTLSSIAPGEYTILLQMNGYSDYTNRVQIAAGMSTSASINLTPSAPSATPSLPSTPVPVPTKSPLSLILVPAGLTAALLLYRRDGEA